ncbi:ATP-binding cassette domain-containing protein [Bacillus mangrovi]|uniref:ATP-binding cassette domain-containing protein n=1 Tax=Metabacillus mangrovi TaxID=1491830 RepID=A0A7X2S735_9BACI|nr:ABC transporter ATP-binding protein [Metabacillus mangrovi]MTH54488.1 ATP-binding cassette domain-containing protein [Metabacillus mangrovi]
MLEVRNVSKTMDGEQVLKDVSFSLEPGEIFGLLGRNGSGKTTLLRLIQQILLPDQGGIFYGNVPLDKNPDLKRKVVYVPIRQSFYDRYTYKQLIRILKPIYPDFDVTYANELMNRYGLSETKKFRDLSTGLKKQFSLIVAFAMRPEVILLDEPTDGIDAVTRHDVLELMIDEVADRQTSIIITSHRLEDVERICSRIAFLEDHTLTGLTDMEEVKENYHKVQLAFEEDIQLRIREKGLPILDHTGVFYTILLEKQNEEHRSWLKAQNPRIWNELPVSLEEVFIAKYGGKRRW